MSKLSELRKKIAALEVEFARTARVEMENSVNKVKSLMASLGVTIEHLGSSSTPTVAKAVANKAPAKKVSKAKVGAKRAGAGVAKYMDPESGKTWTGFGRAPAWIAAAKSRDAFLVGNTAAEPVAEVKSASKRVKTAPKKAPAKKATTRAGKKAAPAAGKKAVAKKAPVKRASVKTAMAKRAAAKSAPAKKRTPKSTASKKTQGTVSAASTAVGASEGA